MASSTTAAAGASPLPPDLFDMTTLVSLGATVAILGVAYAASLRALAGGTPASLRALFIWHAFDALIHVALEGSFLYHCFFSWLPLSSLTFGDIEAKRFYLTRGFLGHNDRVYGPQAGGDNPLAQLWMVYARADRRWAGTDLVRCCPSALCLLGGRISYFVEGGGAYTGGHL